jgi:hypothetical protein
MTAFFKSSKENNKPNKTKLERATCKYNMNADDLNSLFLIDGEPIDSIGDIQSMGGPIQVSSSLLSVVGVAGSGAGHSRTNSSSNARPIPESDASSPAQLHHPASPQPSHSLPILQCSSLASVPVLMTRLTRRILHQHGLDHVPAKSM